MSESILEHGYVAEEHAPDPVTSHGDPTPPGKVAIWLFLASEIMFFIGLLATYIIFRSGSPKIFADHAAALNKVAAGTNTLVLIFSSLTMALAVDAAQKGRRTRAILCLLITLLCATAFMGIKYVEYKDKFTHHTVVAKAAAGMYVYDGHKVSRDAQNFVIEGHRAKIEPGPFDIHWMSGGQVAALEKQQGHAPAAGDAGGGHGAKYTIPVANISQNITYGPWKNVFYASYFITTGVHGLHVVGGMVALACLLAHALMGRLFPPHTEYVGLYWHFVDLVWIFLFPLLYLI